MGQSILDHALICQRYFFPRDERAPHTRDVEVNGHTLRCVHEVFDKRWPTLLYFHGNGEVVADYVPDFVALMKQLCFNVFLAEYRGYGGSGGDPALVAMLDDVEVLAAATGVAPEQLIIFGRSIGSLYAIDLASKLPNAAGLIIESGIANILERILLRASPQELGATIEQLEQACQAHFDHERKLASYKGPTLFLHARWDHLVGVEHAQQNYQWSKSPDKKLIELPHGDHNSVFGQNFTAYMGALIELRARCVDGGPLAGGP